MRPEKKQDHQNRSSLVKRELTLCTITQYLWRTIHATLDIHKRFRLSPKLFFCKDHNILWVKILSESVKSFDVSFQLPLPASANASRQIHTSTLIHSFGEFHGSPERLRNGPSYSWWLKITLAGRPFNFLWRRTQLPRFLAPSIINRVYGGFWLAHQGFLARWVSQWSNRRRSQ